MRCDAMRCDMINKVGRSPVRPSVSHKHIAELLIWKPASGIGSSSRAVWSLSLCLAILADIYDSVDHFWPIVATDCLPGLFLQKRRINPARQQYQWVAVRYETSCTRNDHNISVCIRPLGGRKGSYLRSRGFLYKLPPQVTTCPMISMRSSNGQYINEYLL